MIKRLKRYGNNLVIVFTKEEEITYGLMTNDPIEIPEMIIDEVALSRLNKEKGELSPVKNQAEVSNSRRKNGV